LNVLYSLNISQS